MSGRPAIVVAATPTSNGDLHVGHLAGPYLASDIYARYLRATGRQVVYTTCTDDNQSYVQTTAHRRGLDPAALCATATAAIERSVAAMGISLAGLPPIDERYRRTVLDFVTALHTAGRFRLRTVRLPYAPRSGRYLYDGLVTGTCPVCLGGSCGGACESCGHPNNYDELLDPRSTLDPDEPVTHREHDILVLPMEAYRPRLEAHFAAVAPHWRPHGLHLVGELLARPLPEIPVTVPGSWGLPAPFPETPGQVLYPWIEAMPASMYSTWWAAGQHGAVDELWLAGHDAELVYFHGFDNVYFWGLLDLVMLLAHGERYVRPASNVCNEFYDLDGEKFSTSRNHLIRGAELLTVVPRDPVRFYLALTAPELQRTNFSLDGLRAVTQHRLVRPWNRLADAVDAALASTADPEPATTAAGRRRAAAVAERFRQCYALRGYSAARAAETLAGQLARLAGAPPAEPGDLLLEVRTLLANAAPILVDVAEQAAAAGVDLGLAAEATEQQPSTVARFVLPRLPESVPAEPDPVLSLAHQRAPTRRSGGCGMKLLTIETRQYLEYYHSRYRQVEDFGVELFVLNGEGSADFWPEQRYRLVGSKHIDRMIDTAREWHATERFDGVITFSESAVIAVAAVADALGLPSIGVEAAVCCRNKYLMRRAHAAAGVPHPSFRLVTELADALDAAAGFGYPVVLKPTMGAGSHFVFRVDTPQELELRFEQAMAGIGDMFWYVSEADGVDLGPQGLLVESFLDGREYLMEAVVWDDEVYLGSVVDRITVEGETFDDDVHHAPTAMSDADLAAVHQVVKAAAHAQGLRRSVMHAEVRFHQGRPHLLEIAARVGGGGLDMIARLTADHCPIRAVVDIGRGVKPNVRHFTPTGVHTASMCLISDAGVVDHVEVPAEVSQSPKAFLLKITARPGDLIRRPPDGNTIVGFLGTTGESLEDAFDTMNDFASRITVRFRQPAVVS